MRFNSSLKLTITAILTLTAAVAMGQAMYQDSARVLSVPGKSTVPETIDDLDPFMVDSMSFPEFIPVHYDTVMVMAPLDRRMFAEPIFTHYQFFDNYDPFKVQLSGDEAMTWIERSQAVSQRDAMIWQRFMIAHPELVKKNIAFMEKAPREYYAQVDPREHTIELKEVTIDAPKTIDVFVRKRHWVRTFSATLQFSQAYVSPNWYQGGNNNLNMIANLYYNVKLNPAYHPNLLFESTFQYKLGMNSAPDDNLRNYAISEDLLQINATFGYKAAKRWYYSVTAQFKTQLLNSYVKNTRNLSAAFLSPAEFTAGLGMTYNYVNAKKTLTFDTSIAPLSYNMKICSKSNDKMAHSAYGIEPDSHYKINVGSSAEAKLTWKICSNIQFRSRMFVFTDYNYIQADWENTLSMDINRFLSTQVYVHARYDSKTPQCDDPSWKKLQIKEILSFGFAYKFSSL